MINKHSKLFVSFKEVNEYLVRKGNYGVEVVDGKATMTTIDEPIYKAATKSTTLGYDFLANALNLDKNGKSQRPKCPKSQNIHRWKRSAQGRLADRWNSATDDEKIQVELMAMCHDQNLLLTSFEVL